MDIIVNNKFVTVTTAQGEIHAASYFENARIETAQNVEVANDLSEVTASALPTLPAQGEQCVAGQMYNYNGTAVYCIQTHDRTIYEPAETPALFSVYRTDTGELEWIANEQVLIGAVRYENGIAYECIQAHMTLQGWNPSITPALWQEVTVSIPVWQQPTGAQDAYNIGDQVHFPTINDPVYESIINANVWSPSVYPAGWQIIN